MAGPLLEAIEVKKYFSIGSGMFGKPTGHVRAVDGVSFDIKKAETFSVVGESGCGKSTLGRLLLGLLECTGGKVTFRGRDITLFSKQELRQLRRNMQMIFQDPYASLNGRMTVSNIIREPMIIHGLGSRAEQKQKVNELLGLVGLSGAYAQKYPHEFSGGQRQRIGIARALALNPEFIVCDEPVSALDVSIQSQVLNLLKDLQEQFNLTYMFVSHDLSVVRYISDRVAVMYVGKFVEVAATGDLFQQPAHPYTKALLASIPVPKAKSGRRGFTLEGDVPSPINPPSGCRFHPRCPQAGRECQETEPDLKEVSVDHLVACHRVTY
ncbi:MAG TPA: dipeptide ABC transporter ATP-binding protein [Firmicutes bacterium]|jgi:oligopeptide transport system ATP-binding protein|nr:dipeptide ABC transporter ATP-binding protein [Bacillota bacterium]